MHETKYTIEIMTEAGWVNYHTMLRPCEDRTNIAIKELKTRWPKADFRMMKWTRPISMPDKA